LRVLRNRKLWNKGRLFEEDDRSEKEPPKLTIPG